MRRLFIAKDNSFTGRTEYRSRHTGKVYSVGRDLSENCNYGFNAEGPGIVILSDSRAKLLSLIELADRS